jgi:protein SCO1/2
VAPDFTLIDQNEQPFRLADARGKVVLIFFGFVQCPDVCPATLSTWVKVAKRLGAERDQVRFLYITVDPERDTPANLGRHLKIFAPDFIGLTGTQEQLEAVYRDYGVKHNKLRLFEGAKGYVMEHTSHTFLVDPDGILRLTYQYNARSRDVFADVRWLLDHHSPAAGSEAIRVENVWSRPTAAHDGEAQRPAPGSAPGVMYLSIVNGGVQDERLIAVRTDVCEVAEIHETTHREGSSRMGPVNGGVPVPAGERVDFAPGGLHVMLLGLRRDLLAGERFPVELIFESGRETRIEVEVRAP